jgi:phosphate transport system substrate-binding protein
MKKTFKGASFVAIAAMSASTLIAGVAGAAQGDGKKGDIDLITPSASIAFGGSSFSAPFVTFMANKNNTGAYKNVNATFGTDSAAGSGDGRSGVTGGTYQIGFSDQPMNLAAGTLPSGVNPADYTQIPLALGGAVVAYNLPGHSDLKLSASTIALIYNGKITKWDNAAIAATNPGVTLPNTTITVEYRSASSGTTYAFTDYLARATQGKTPTGASGAVMEGTGKLWGAGTTGTVAAASNNAAMATQINNTEGAIGYVEYSYLLVPGNHLQAAMLQDAAGAYISPTLTTIAAAATAAVKTITTENFSITYQAGKNVWPLATYTWAIIKNAQADAAKGELAVKFLDYFVQGGQASAAANGFVALPKVIQVADHKALAAVKNGSTVLLNIKK